MPPTECKTWRRILVVEDEALIAAFVVKALRGDGTEVVVAEDGEVGLFLASTDNFDAVVLDLQLPGLNGLDVLRDLRGRGCKVPILVLTGEDEPDVRAVCLRLGADAFLTKPFSIGELRAGLAARLAHGAVPGGDPR